MAPPHPSCNSSARVRSWPPRRHSARLTSKGNRGVWPFASTCSAASRQPSRACADSGGLVHRHGHGSRHPQSRGTLRAAASRRRRNWRPTLVASQLLVGGGDRFDVGRACGACPAFAVSRCPGAVPRAAPAPTPTPTPPRRVVRPARPATAHFVAPIADAATGSEVKLAGPWSAWRQYRNVAWGTLSRR
jgi:hypothetical protein